MIRNTININGYWKVIVYYNVNYNFFNVIYKDLKDINCSKSTIDKIYHNMFYNNAKGVTISNTYLYTSIVLLNKHKDYYDYINSIVHEAEHIKQSILKTYNIKDEGEPPAYTIGYIAKKMLIPVLLCFVYR
jgi:hypothetical protein